MKFAALRFNTFARRKLRIELCIELSSKTKGKSMSILKSEAEQARAQHSNLVKHYRPIGPAAIAAAVAIRKRKRVPDISHKPMKTEVSWRGTRLKRVLADVTPVQ
jgi:hypothetical protein